MGERKQRYFIRVQYLGFRYSGWQHQPGQRTIEGMLVKTLKFILPGRTFKILGAGRTDAKVSALDAAFELFLVGNPLEDENTFLDEFNRNLPPDIRVMEIAPSNEKFNVIHDVGNKEYVYLFSFGKKNHPFCAPYMANILSNLDIEVMKLATNNFIGTHNFSLYTAHLQKKTKVIRTVDYCEIRENDFIKASFFPDESWAFIVRGTGFMRYQIRMMMGALIQLGKGELATDDIGRSLVPDPGMRLKYVAPASGLFLNRLDFK